MSGCLEGYQAVANALLSRFEYNDLITALENEANKSTSSLSELRPWVFYSSTNPEPIITMKGGQFSAAAAMAIRDGKVLCTGTLDDCKQATGLSREVRDLKSQCIVPGFIEPHLHIILSAMLQGFLNNCDPLNPDTDGTFEGTKDFLRSKAQKLGPGQWLLGFGYDPSRLPPYDSGDEKGKFKDLTWDVFDDITDQPAFIVNASGHLAYANRQAFTLAGIKAGDVSPSGGTYVVGKDNVFTGILIEPPAFQAFLTKAVLSNIVKSPEVIAGLHAVVTQWSQCGFTTVFDAGVGQMNPSLDASVLFALSLVAPLRICGAAANLSIGDATKVVGNGPMPENGATNLGIKTIKLWMDGSTQGFTAALKNHPYEPGSLPDYFVDQPYGWARWQVENQCPAKAGPADIYEEMESWALKGYQLMVHVNGDCASEVVLEAYKSLTELSPQPPKMMHRLEHFTVTNPDQVQKAGELGLGVSHTIGHVKYWGQTFKKYILDGDTASRIDPVKDDLDHQVVYSFNSDSPVSQADALSYVRTAATRIMFPKDDEVLGPKQKVSVEAALAGVTINPAKQILRDDEIGTLESEKSADFVILNQDLRTMDARDISSSMIAETWFKGVQRYLK